MADPELVEYLRKNLKQFGGKALREKLVSEGVAEADIDAAMAVAIRPPQKGPRLGMYVVFAAVAVTAVSLYMAIDKPTKNPPLSATPAAELTGADKPNKSAFMGHYGYMLKVPDGYISQSSFKDMNNTTELVYLYPEKTDPTNLANEGLYGQLGILRLEVSPRRIPQGTVGLDALRAAITGNLSQRGVTFTPKDFVVGGLHAFQVNVTQPFPLVQAFIIGTKVMYVLTGGVENQTFNDTLQSLTEVSPHDRPGGTEAPVPR